MVIEAMALVFALGIDAFACSFGYGANKIKIPFKSVLMINLICTALLLGGLFFGNLLSNVVSEQVTIGISFSILFLFGMIKIFDSTIKKLIRHSNGINKNFKFTMFNLFFVLNVYANPEEADSDHSKSLCLRESVPLAVALGLDGLSVGFGIGLAAGSMLLIGSLSFTVGILMVIAGCFLGNKLAQKTDLDVSWLSGAILIMIAIHSLF